MSETVLKQVAALPSLEYEELKEMWDNLFDEPPRSHNKIYIIRRLAWRIQELAYGGLSKDTTDHIKKLNNKPATYFKQRKMLPPVGTQLIREYNGTEHHVMVLPNGFEYEKVMHGSLSEIARKITGTRWSGPKFFGLK